MIKAGYEYGSSQGCQRDDARPQKETMHLKMLSAYPCLYYYNCGTYVTTYNTRRIRVWTVMLFIDKKLLAGFDGRCHVVIDTSRRQYCKVIMSRRHTVSQPELLT